jgi:hypothetical protein
MLNMEIQLKLEKSKRNFNVNVLKDAFVAHMFKILSKPYLKVFKRKKIAWPLAKAELLLFEKDSLGYKIGDFLNKNGYEIEAKMEEHDVFHVLSDTPTQVLDEIRLKFYMYGNGKRSIFLGIVLLVGFVLYTSKVSKFKKSYRLGNASLPFHDLDFYDKLHVSYSDIKTQFKIKSNK